MTNREAIEALKDLLDTTQEYPHLDGMTMFGDALNMAIAALEKQGEDNEWCLDCKEYDKEQHCCHRFTKVIRQAVEDHRREWPDSKWIPVTERLPEKAGRYLVIARWSENMDYLVDALDYGFKVNEDWEGTDYIFPNGGAFGEDWNGEIDNLEKDIIAWMPLPEPYKEDKA